MSDIKSKIDAVLIQLQYLLDEAGLDESEVVQDAFNALACVLDDVVY
jgi:hypothetical protein